jgi:hypothetical protein
MLGQLPAVYVPRKLLLFAQALPRMQSRIFIRLARRLAAVLSALSKELGGFCPMHGSLSVIDCNLGINRLSNLGYLIAVWFTLSYLFRPTYSHLHAIEIVQL